MTRYLKHARLLAGALALVVGLTLAAPPAFAGGPAPEPRPIAAAAAAKVEAMPAATLAQATPAAQAAPAALTEAGDKPFFKTTKGVVALALLAGGLGYTVYSFSNDRVSSPQR